MEVSHQYYYAIGHFGDALEVYYCPEFGVWGESDKHNIQWEAEKAIKESAQKCYEKGLALPEPLGTNDVRAKFDEFVKEKYNVAFNIVRYVSVNIPLSSKA